MSKFNFEGYGFFIWLKKNKEFLKIAVPVLISFFVAKNWVTIGFSAILGKFILDAIDYWMSE